jgi:type IV pilus assembly protein PilA
MFNNLRRRAEDEKGFTLIELLVVILIIGILAAIAIPAFLNQRSKAYDSQAKSNIKTAQTAEETYSTDHQGTYAPAETLSPTDSGTLVTIEPSLKTSPAVTATPATSASDGYTLVSTASGSGTGDIFSLTDASGNVTRSCTGTGGGCVNSSW